MKSNLDILAGDLVIKGRKDSIITKYENNDIYIKIKDNANIFIPKTKKNIHIEALENTKSDIFMTSNMNTYVDIFGGASITFKIVELEKSEAVFKCNLNEALANVEINTLVITSQNVIMHQEVYHKAINTTSLISNYGVAANYGQISFDTTGKIYNKMSNSNCRQLSKGFILGDEAKITSKPILLIDEYDVKAYHGAAIGKMNEDDLFYLMSRGLTRNEAYSLVLDGILEQYLSSIEDEAIKSALEEKIHNIL